MFDGSVFIPILSISMALSTFVSHNRGASEWNRVKKGSLYGILSSMIVAQLPAMVFIVIGILQYRKLPS